MKLHISVEFEDDAGMFYEQEFDSSEYADIRNALVDASVFIYKKLNWEPMEPKAFRDYCKARKGALNWKSDAIGDG